MYRFLLALLLTTTLAGTGSAECCCRCRFFTRVIETRVERRPTTPVPAVLDEVNKVAFPFHFEVYKDKKKEWRWRLQAANNRIIADSGEGYKNRSDCIHGIQLVQNNATSATIVIDNSAPTK